ncbi:enoyl-CoA hydratase/isomerase family protein [bacterium]|nr:enoyl-CoA hydratase/isomerase family protein [bacterium]
MNRPDRRNAFNTQMVEDLTQAFEAFEQHDSRAVLLSGEGSAFSAGADLEYMKSIKDAGREENIKDADKLADLLHLIYRFPKPVVARIHGPAIGGGVGLVAACDIAVASQHSFFAFSEVRLGLVPAVIGPYVVRKIGESAARYYMLTAHRFHAEEAQRIGLIQKTTVLGDLDNAVNAVLAELVQGGPEALDACKRLIQRISEDPADEVRPWTAELIADLRASTEGQEGIGAFLEKRSASWKSS